MGAEERAGLFSELSDGRDEPGPAAVADRRHGGPRGHQGAVYSNDAPRSIIR
jgi:hypothetical protein